MVASHSSDLICPFMMQGTVTKEGPVSDLMAFLADPAHNNIIANLSGEA